MRIAMIYVYGAVAFLVICTLLEGLFLWVEKGHANKKRERHERGRR